MRKKRTSHCGVIFTGGIIRNLINKNRYKRGQDLIFLAKNKKFHHLENTRQ